MEGSKDGDLGWAERKIRGKESKQCNCISFKIYQLTSKTKITFLKDDFIIKRQFYRHCSINIFMRQEKQNTLMFVHNTFDTLL